jgi:hypothetical protein
MSELQHNRLQPQIKRLGVHSAIGIWLHDGLDERRHSESGLSRRTELSLLQGACAGSPVGRRVPWRAVSASELEYQDWARLQGRGPHTAGRVTAMATAAAAWAAAVVVRLSTYVDLRIWPALSMSKRTVTALAAEAAAAS